MKLMRGLKLTLGAGLLCPVIACAPGGTDVASVSEQSPGTAPAQPRASRIAQTLAEAETAYEAGATDRLMVLVNALEASGLATRDGAEADMLEAWSKAAGIDGTPFRGRLLGPAYVRGALGPGEIWKSAQTFKSGVSSTLAVSHKGAGPVSIKVSDQSSRLVCNPRSERVPACRFTPLYTQRYEIELTNEGTERAVYFLVFD